MKFYRVYNQRTKKFMNSANTNCWEHHGKRHATSLIKKRSNMKQYNWNDFILIEFEVDKLPVWYYYMNEELVLYDEHKDMVEALYE